MFYQSMHKKMVDDMEVVRYKEQQQFVVVRDRKTKEVRTMLIKKKR